MHSLSGWTWPLILLTNSFPRVDAAPPLNRQVTRAGDQVNVVPIPHLQRRQAGEVTLTSLPSAQVPTITDATGTGPDTTGSIVTSLQTEGRSSVQPFPTSIPSAVETTIQPAATTLTPQSGTTVLPPVSVTAPVTLPLATLRTVVIKSTVARVPVQTVLSVSSVTVLPTTITSGATPVTTVTPGLTVLATTVTVLSEITIANTQTVTNTVSTVVSSGVLASILPSSTPTCSISNANVYGAENIFKPVGVNPPPNLFPYVDNHPVPRLGITGQTGPLETNKFYSNFHLGTQTNPAFVQPYSLSWSKGSGNAQSWGMAVSHVDDFQKVFGPVDTRIPGSPSSYFINPLGIQSVILSAAELGPDTALTTSNLAVMSADATLAPFLGATSSIRFPMVQGMAFVTGIYTSLQPELQSSVFFRFLLKLPSPKPGVFKYRVQLEDGKFWLIYAIPELNVDPNFQLVSSTLLQGIPRWSGYIQVTKVPEGASESQYDTSVGVYPTSGDVAGYALNSNAEYALSWAKGGKFINDTLLMWALPHHVQSFTSVTAGKITPYRLQTTVKGVATAVLADCWTLREVLPVSMGFAPWRPSTGAVRRLTPQAITAIQKIAPSEASQNIGAQTNLDSMYFSGKALSKFATLIYTMNDLANQSALAATALTELKKAFAVWGENRQQYPLYYETCWKGIVSSGSYATGWPGMDFGNSYYNDHHFHYAYFIHTAAVIGYLDPTWVAANKEFVNSLIRDVSNPSNVDQYFPIFRSFDWYHGHSWAKGLFESADGKDQESFSEDFLFAYAIKMWGKTIGDKSMEARGNLMLAVLSRSTQNYVLMQNSNKNQPAQFIGNKATGILFENKADHVTYFGINMEYIQGIQMIPVMPFSTLERNEKFVTEEWNQYFAQGAVSDAQTVQDGWRGILFGNLAIINPQASYNFFSQAEFRPEWLDGGASRSWYLAYAAALTPQYRAVPNRKARPPS